MMLEHNFTLKEFAILTEVEHRSDELVKLEIKAMNMIEGKYQDKDGNYTIVGKPNPKLAQNLVFSDEYAQAKLGIMRPLQAFCSC